MSEKYPDLEKAFPSLTEEEFEKEVGLAHEGFERAWKEAHAKLQDDPKTVRFTNGVWRSIRKMFVLTFCEINYWRMAQREERLKLEARVAALEARPELRDAGPWKAGKQYRSGEIVSYQGSAWICRQDTETRPAGSPCWRLLVKRGKDAT